MIIRKLFKFEGSHIVRDCSSERCRYSIHGHSFKVEIFLSSNYVDNGQMVVDFGLLKTHVKDMIDSFDHAYILWRQEKDDFKDFITSNSCRYVITPYSPSAEMLSVILFALITDTITNTEFNNGEYGVKLSAVRVHETDTGYAEACYDDYRKYWVDKGFCIDNILFSQGIKDEWKDPQMDYKIKNGIKFVNPIVNIFYA